MNTLKKLILSVVLLSSITAWADRNDDNYMSYIQPYLGDYAGSFDGHSGTLRLSVSGNDVVAEFFSSRGDDYGLIRGCDAMIGHLDRADVDEDDGEYSIDKLVFNFDAGNCRNIEGREITFDFKHSGGAVNTVNLSVLEYTETRYDNCYNHPYPGYPGGGYPYPGYPYPGYPSHCSPTYYQHTMTGKFSKL